MNTHTNSFQLPLPLDSGVVPQPAPRAWRYLLADSLVFSKSVEDGIRIQKPTCEKLALWISRLVSCGQCATIYVENLSLTTTEMQNVAVLCKQKGVSLINITVTSEAKQNLVVGPW